MSERKILLRNLPFVKVWSIVPSKGSRFETYEYARSYPEDAEYMIEVTFFPTHISSRGKETKLSKTMSSCIFRDKYSSYGNHVGFSDFPSRLDCDRCSFACKTGRMWSEVEFGQFVSMVCAECGEDMRGKVWGVDACPKCGGLKVVAKVRGKPHVHGKYWVFELHILNHDASVTLGELLGVEFDNQLRFSCKGSWHNFRNDSSGFDVCHVNCLNDLIETRIKKDVSGIDLFMANYPEEGKVMLGNNKFVKCWIEGEVLTPSEYFVRTGKGIPTKRE